ncbi:hypothetical protein Tco_0512762, partial [Tanacetum coccineum]
LLLLRWIKGPEKRGKLLEGLVVPAPKKLRANHGTSDANGSTGEKSVAALQGLLMPPPL